jgi:hypothetical protein
MSQSVNQIPHQTVHAQCGNVALLLDCPACSVNVVSCNAGECADVLYNPLLEATAKESAAAEMLKIECLPALQRRFVRIADDGVLGQMEPFCVQLTRTLAVLTVECSMIRVVIHGLNEAVKEDQKARVLAAQEQDRLRKAEIQARREPRCSKSSACLL